MSEASFLYLRTSYLFIYVLISQYLNTNSNIKISKQKFNVVAEAAAVAEVQYISDP